jgi:zinc protease
MKHLHLILLSLTALAVLAATTACQNDDVATDSHVRPSAPSQLYTTQEQTPEALPEATARPVEIVKQIATPTGENVLELSNGMTLIVKPLRTAPVVSVYGLVHTGAMYEGTWLGCGLSHLAEHLVAKESISGDPHTRTKGYGVGTKRPRTLEIGGQSNAMTSLDYTGYYISAAASKTDDCIELICDQLARPDITPEDFDREHGVVQRELEMNLDDPARIMSYTHNEDVFRTHPAAVPIIGYAEPLSRVTIEDIRDYLARKYVPQNMALVIVGDIDVRKAVDTALASLQGFPAGRQPDHTLPDVPPVTGVRRTVRPSKALRGDHQRISFQTIPLIHPDLYPLDVLSYILSQGRASRLVKTLQLEKRLVTSINTWSWTPSWGKGTFTVDFRCEPGQADAAEQAVLAELQRILDHGVNADELARAKRQKVADYVRSQQEAGDIAFSLGSDYLHTGDVTFSKRYTDNIQKVTAEQVQAAARKYLDPQRMVITRLVPAGAHDLALAGADANTRQTIETFTLPNGLTVVLQPTDAVDLVSMAMAVKGGLLLETPETNGLGELMTSLSSRGAGEYSGEQIDAFFNAAGGGIGAMCGDNSFLYRAEVLADDWHEALDIFAAVVTEPTFPADQLETIRPLLLDAIRRSDEHWQSQLSKFFRRQFFTDSPWRMLSSGSRDVVTKATIDDVRAWHERSILAGGATLAVVGNFDAADARTAIEKRFGKISEGKPEMALPDARTVQQAEYYALQTSTQQAGVIVAVPGVSMAETHDRLALMLMDTIISGYRLPSGWLHTELRGKELVYVVHAYLKTGLAPGAFLTYAGTKPDKAQEVVDIILKNYSKAAQYLPSQKELDQAINMIVTAEALENQKLGSIATQHALDTMYGLGADWPREMESRMRELTPEDVHAVAKKYLSVPPVVTVITPEPAALSDDAHVVEPETTAPAETPDTQEQP